MRQAQVIGVHVGCDHAQHRQAVQTVGKHLAPLIAGLRVVQTAIDNGPALHTINAVLQQPQVDVVQGKRQSHADPVHPLGHLQGLTNRS
jgi:hypothetical protein